MLMDKSTLVKALTLPFSCTSARCGSRSVGIGQALPGYMPWLLVASLYCILIAPAAALDSDPYALALPSFHQPHPGGHSHAPIGTLTQLCFLISGVVVMVSGHLLGPIMGVTSVLWLMMRNDSAIDPRLSWMVFGAWSFFFFAYFMFQCRRVYNHRLYVFLSLALAAICVCVVALLQRASLQSGLVTVIPPCASFAVYSIAYFFPNRHPEMFGLAV